MIEFSTIDIGFVLVSNGINIKVICYNVFKTILCSTATIQCMIFQKDRFFNVFSQIGFLKSWWLQHTQDRLNSNVKYVTHTVSENESGPLRDWLEKNYTDQEIYY